MQTIINALQARHDSDHRKSRGTGMLAFTPDILKAHADRQALLDIIRDMTGLLNVARCPNCDGSGAIMTRVGAEQCQWCGVKNEILNRTEP